MDKKMLGLLAIGGAAVAIFYFLNKNKTSSSDTTATATAQPIITPVITTPTVIVSPITTTETITYAPSNINAPTTTITNITSPSPFYAPDIKTPVSTPTNPVNKTSPGTNQAIASLPVNTQKNIYSGLDQGVASVNSAINQAVQSSINPFWK